MAAKFAPGANVSALTARLTPLLRQSGGRWTLTADGMGLERSFRFKTFTKTWVRTLAFLKEIWLFLRWRYCDLSAIKIEHSICHDGSGNPFDEQRSSLGSEHVFKC